MTKKDDIEAFIKMMDQNMAQGAGHINVKVNTPGKLQVEEVNIVSKMDCDSGDTACKIPNLQMDDDDLY